MSFTLYDYALSGNCYKIRLFANILHIEYERIAVGFYPEAEYKSEKMLALCPAGTLPILQCGNMMLSDSNAMLYWMAKTYDETASWLPEDDIAQQALVFQWLGFAHELTATLGKARLNALFQIDIDVVSAQKGALNALRKLEAHLTEQTIEGRQFLVGDSPTIADIACFPHVALSPDMGLEHDDFPAIRNWLYRVKSLEGFIPMPGIYAMHELREHETDSGKLPLVSTDSNQT